MEERTYKLMNKAGALSLVMGVISIVTGVVCGVMLLVSGAKLISDKKNIMF